MVFGIDEWATNTTDAALLLLRQAIRLRVQDALLGNVSISPRTTPSLSGRDAFSFCEGTEAPVFSSRENEASLLRMTLESANHGVLPLDNVASVQIINPLNEDRSELDIDVVKTSPIETNVRAVVDPIALLKMKNGASLSDRRLKNSAFSFDMVVTVVPAESNREVELCYRLCWRTVARLTPTLCPFGRRVALSVQARLPQPLRSAVGCMLGRKKRKYRKAMELECRTIRYAA